MATTESDILRDEQERSNLLRTIASVEAAIAASTPGTRRVLETTVDNARKRITTLDKKIEEAKVERAAELQAQTAAAELAAKETRLSAKEQDTYRGFLEESYFTKKDFGKLKRFYAHSYDRLSENGKDEMSHRVWEGMRDGKYEFEELPEEVRKKEAKLAYKKLTATSLDFDVQNVQATDRNDFLQAFEVGDQKAESQILSRDSFKQNMSVKTSTGATHQAAKIERASDGIFANKPSEPLATPGESSAMTAFKQNAAALKNLMLVDTSEAPSAAALPIAVTPNVSGRSPG